MRVCTALHACVACVRTLHVHMHYVACTVCAACTVCTVCLRALGALCVCVRYMSALRACMHMHALRASASACTVFEDACAACVHCVCAVRCSAVWCGAADATRSCVNQGWPSLWFKTDKTEDAVAVVINFDWTGAAQQPFVANRTRVVHACHGNPRLDTQHLVPRVLPFRLPWHNSRDVIRVAGNSDPNNNQSEKGLAPPVLLTTSWVQ